MPEPVLFLDPQQWRAPIPHRGYGTILADSPWLVANRTGKITPEHRRYYAIKHDPTYVPPQCLELHEGQEALSDADQYVLVGRHQYHLDLPPPGAVCVSPGCYLSRVYGLGRGRMT